MHCYRIQMDLCVDRKVIKQNVPQLCLFPAASISCTLSLLFDACLLSSISFASMTYIEGSYLVRRPYHQYHLIFSLSQLSICCGGTAAVESVNALLKNMDGKLYPKLKSIVRLIDSHISLPFGAFFVIRSLSSFVILRWPENLARYRSILTSKRFQTDTCWCSSSNPMQVDIETSKQLR